MATAELIVEYRGGVGAAFALKMTLPRAKWATRPCAKLVSAFAKAAGARLAGVDAASLEIARADGSVVDGDAPVSTLLGVSEKATVAIRPRPARAPKRRLAPVVKAALVCQLKDASACVYPRVSLVFSRPVLPRPSPADAAAAPPRRADAAEAPP